MNRLTSGSHMRKISTNLACVSLLLMGLLMPRLMLAQSTAVLTGTVTDPSGAALPGAEVVCTNVSTAMHYMAQTNGRGIFRFSELPVGTYELTVSHPGFEQLVQSNVVLLTSQTVALDLKLRVGSIATSVEVKAPTPLVQTESSTLQTSVDERQMRDLPLNGRNAFDLAQLVPGAVETDAGSIMGQQENTSLAVNGARPTENEYVMDGVTYMNKQYDSAPVLPNPDTLQEFTVQTSDFSAVNQGAGAVVALTTRSGTNQFHGTLFEYLRNDRLDTRNYFSKNVEIYKRNQYGGTLGGPIRRNKLFFFGSFQGTNTRGKPSPLILTVPTAAEHSGDFSQTGRSIVDPTTGKPFSNDTIPTSRFDPLAVELMKYFPLPDAGVNTYLEAPPSNEDDYQWMYKMDYQAGSRDHLSGRFFWDYHPFQDNNNTVPGFSGNDAFHEHSLEIGDTHTFGGTWVLRGVFTFLQTHRTDVPVAAVDMQELGAQIPLATPNPPKKIYVSFSGYTNIDDSRGITFSPSEYDYEADVSHVAGAHMLRFGFQFERVHQYALNLGDERGNWAFNAAETSSKSIKNSGDAIASFLLGLPHTFSEDSTASHQFVESEVGAYIQDDWKVQRRLTLNLGVRWDPWLPAYDSAGPLIGFEPGAQSTLAPLAPAGLVYSGDPGIPRSILSDDWNGFSPRFGFAFDMFGNGRTVLRAAYGIYHSDNLPLNVIRNIAGSAPGLGRVSLTINAPPSTENPYEGYQGTIPFPVQPISISQLATYQFPSGLGLTALDLHAKYGYNQMWNLSIERQLGTKMMLSLAYTGSHFLNGMSRMQVNPAVYGPGATTKNTNSRRLYPAFGSISQETSYNYGNYNGLQAQVVRRATRGLTLLANYTYAKALDADSSGEQGTANGQGPFDPFDLARNYGPADFDATHEAKVALIYDVPAFGASGGFAHKLSNGWQVNSIVLAETGFPFTCRSGVDNAFSGMNNQTCDQIQANTGRPAGANPVMEWFNVNAFTENAIGTFGDTGRNILRRPGLFNTDFSLFRAFPITERVKMELRAEAFNLFNHPNFSLFNNPGTYSASETFTSPTFGQVLAARDPRLIQVALRLSF